MTEWIKCSDRLPEEHERVLAYSEEEIHEAFWYKGSRFDATGIFEKNTDLIPTTIWTYYDFMEWEGVTHWMPLPKAPNDI